MLTWPLSGKQQRKQHKAHDPVCSCDPAGLVESKPQVYEWAGYRQLIRLICDMGFKVKVR